jgi:hypothetical protein
MSGIEGWPGTDFDSLISFEGLVVSGDTYKDAVERAQALVNKGYSDEVIPVPCDPGMAPAKKFLEKLAVHGLSNESNNLGIY